MGLFSPAWMSKNEVHAVKAVQKISDDAQLWTILRETKSPAVGLAALKQVPDANLDRISAAAIYGGTKEVAAAAYQRLLKLDVARSKFADIAASSRYVQEIALPAVAELRQQSELFEVAGKTYSADVWRAAAERLTNAGLYARLIMQPTASEKLYRDDPMLEPAVRCERERRLAMLKNTTNKDVLLTVAVSSDDGQFAQYAADAIASSEKNAILTVAMKAEHRTVAESALSRLSGDISRLQCCADDRSRWDSVRNAAATQLLQSSSAAHLEQAMDNILCAKSGAMRKAAYCLISENDQKVSTAYLKKLAQGKEGNLPTYLALSAVKDPKLHNKVLLHGTDESAETVLRCGCAETQALQAYMADQSKRHRAAALDILYASHAVAADELALYLTDEALCHTAARYLALTGDMRALPQCIADKNIESLSHYPCRESVDALLSVILSATASDAAKAERAIKKLYTNGMADYVRSMQLSKYKRQHIDTGKDSCHTDQPGVSFCFVHEVD